MRKIPIFLLLATILTTFTVIGYEIAAFTDPKCVVEGDKVMNYLFLEDKAFEMALKCGALEDGCEKQLEIITNDANLALQVLKHDLRGCHTSLSSEQKAHILLPQKGQPI